MDFKERWLKHSELMTDRPTEPMSMEQHEEVLNRVIVQVLDRALRGDLNPGEYDRDYLLEWLKNKGYSLDAQVVKTEEGFEAIDSSSHYGSCLVVWSRITRDFVNLRDVRRQESIADVAEKSRQVLTRFLTVFFSGIAIILVLLIAKWLGIDPPIIRI